MIRLTYGGKFNEDDLVNFVQSSKQKSYIIQGQVACKRSDHPKRNSLDYWLRYFAKTPDTKQADNRILGELVATGKFTVSFGLACPDTGRLCKGLVLNSQI